MTTTKEKPIVTGFGTNMFNGKKQPLILLAGRTIFHGSDLKREKRGYKTNRKGEIMREYKGGPPLIDWHEEHIPARLEWLGDRKTWAGKIFDANPDFYGKFKETPEFNAFKDWMDTKAMPALQPHLDDWTGMSTDVFELEEVKMCDKFHLRASNNASGGYCYIAIWMEEA